MPATSPRCGMTFAAEPACDDAPHHAHPRARVEAARQDAGQLGGDLASAKVRSPVRCGRRGVAAGALRRTSSVSAAPVIGPSRRPTWPTSTLGSQCSAKIRLDAVERAELHQVQRAAGHDLLGGLEEQPDPAGQQPAGVRLGQGQGGAEQGRGVDVVAAGVGDAGHGAGPRVDRGVLHRQRVEVGPQRHQRARSRRGRRRARSAAAGSPATRPARAAAPAARSSASPPRTARGGRAGRGGGRELGVVLVDDGVDAARRVRWHHRRGYRGTGVPGAATHRGRCGGHARLPAAVSPGGAGVLVVGGEEAGRPPSSPGARRPAPARGTSLADRGHAGRAAQPLGRARRGPAPR